LAQVSGGGQPRRAPALEEAFVPLDEAARRLGYAGTDWRAAARDLPVRWPRGYLELAESPEGEPLRRIGVPDPRELRPDPLDRPDPVGEAGRAEHPFLVRKHRDRALVLVTARCHFYCRFCFRRRFPDGGHADPPRPVLDEALEAALADPEVREVILSGGDPLALDDDRLRAIVDRVAEAPQVETLRVHTRAPVHLPERVTDALAALLAAGKPAWVAVHFSHPVELRPGSLAALARLRRAGLGLLDQTVLLRGVNDDPGVLAELCRRLYAERVKPYYLHHPDAAPGNAAFRLGIERGLEIHAALRERVPGPALPDYVIDLPDGSGKVPVASLEQVGEGLWRDPRSGCRLREAAPPA
jgi:lysine 2,3-aminomutase